MGRTGGGERTTGEEVKEERKVELRRKLSREEHLSPCVYDHLVASNCHCLNDTQNYCLSSHRTTTHRFLDFYFENVWNDKLLLCTTCFSGVELLLVNIAS